MSTTSRVSARRGASRGRAAGAPAGGAEPAEDLPFSRVARKRIRRPRTPLQWVASIIGELMVTFGVFLLLFAAWQVWWTDMVANDSQSQTVNTLEQVFVDGGKAKPGEDTGGVAVADSSKLADLKDLNEGEAWGIMRIPRLGRQWERPLLQGVGLEYLNHGVGHYPDTAMPGEVGNFSVAGHRTTWGRPFYYIETLEPGDPIIIETSTMWYVYRYKDHQIVRPDQTQVILPVPNQPGATPTKKMITLTACHPKFSAAERWVARGELERTYTRAQGLPKDLADQLTIGGS